jgi:hypothetical protein
MLKRFISPALILVGCGRALTAPIVVSNASFELPLLAPGAITFAGTSFSPEQNPAIPGWGGYLHNAPEGGFTGATVSAGIRNATNAVDGHQTLWMQIHAQTQSTVGDIYQDVGELWPNTTYILKVAAGGPPSGFDDGSSGAIYLFNGTYDTLLGWANCDAVAGTTGLTDHIINCTTGPTMTGRLVIHLEMRAGPFGTFPHSWETDFDNVRLDAFQGTTDPPILRIAVQADTIAVRWPPWATNYWLEATAALSSNPSWFQLTNTSAISGNQLLLPTPPTGSAFFRLRQQ